MSDDNTGGGVASADTGILPPDTSVSACPDCLSAQQLNYAASDISRLYLCEECGIGICQVCSLSPYHEHHAVKPFLLATQETKNSILGLLQTIKAKLKSLETASKISTEKKPSGIPVRPGLRRAVSHTPPGTALRHQATVCPQTLLDQEACLTQSRNRLTNVCLDIENLLKEDSITAILRLKRLMTSSLLKSLTDEPAKITQLCGNGAKLSRSVSNGNDNRDVICAVTSGLSKDGTIITTPGKEVKLRLFFWSRDVRSRPSPAEDLTCTLESVAGVSAIDAEPVPKVQLRQLRTDTFEASFRLEKESVYRLRIALGGCPVNGSPYSVFARCPSVREEAIRESLFSPCSSVMGWKSGRPVSPRSVVSEPLKKGSNRMSDVEEDDLLILKVGTAGREAGCFLNPQGICIVNEEFFAVTDSNIGCIQLFSLDGRFVRRFGARGRKPGQIIRPTGIAFLPKCQNRWETDVLVVADYENRTVVLFDMDGNCLHSFGSAKLTGPKGVAVALNGDIIVVDNRSNSLFVFRTCKLYKKIWAPSSSAAHLAGPHYVTVSKDTGDILVTDFHHHTVKVFDAEYNYRWSFGSFNADAGMGPFSGPTGVAADHRGIAVADWGSGRIQIFDNTGSFLAYVTTLSNPLYGPQGLAIAQDGTIFACDSGRHSVRVYRHPLA